MSRPIGFEQITALGTVKMLTLPNQRDALAALVQAEIAPVRWRMDGPDPTTAVGHVIPVGGAILISDALDKIEFIEDSAGAILNITYFASPGDLPLIIGAGGGAAGGGGGDASAANQATEIAHLAQIEAALEVGPVPVTVSGTVDVDDQSGAHRTVDSVGATMMGDGVILGDTPPVFYPFQRFSETVAASDSDEELVPLSAAQRIVVVSFIVQQGAPPSAITFQSNGAGRLHKVGANGIGQAPGFSLAGHFETVAGENLTVDTGVGSDTEISGTYYKAP